MPEIRYNQTVRHNPITRLPSHTKGHGLLFSLNVPRVNQVTCVALESMASLVIFGEWVSAALMRRRSPY